MTFNFHLQLTREKLVIFFIAENIKKLSYFYDNDTLLQSFSPIFAFQIIKIFFFVPFRLVDEGDFIETIKFNDSLTLSFGAGKFEFFKKMKSLW